MRERVIVVILFDLVVVVFVVAVLFLFPWEQIKCFPNSQLHTQTTGIVIAAKYTSSAEGSLSNTLLCNIVRQLSNRFGDDVDALDKSTNFFYKLLIVLALYFW